MEEGSGVFRRMGASIDARMRTVGALAPGRCIRRVGRWVIQIVAWLSLTALVAGVGAVVGTILYIVLRALGVVPPITNNTTNWWAVIGGALAVGYSCIVLIWLHVKERRIDRRYERESEAARDVRDPG